MGLCEDLLKTWILFFYVAVTNPKSLIEIKGPLHVGGVLYLTSSTFSSSVYLKPIGKKATVLWKEGDRANLNSGSQLHYTLGFNNKIIFLFCIAE